MEKHTPPTCAEPATQRCSAELEREEKAVWGGLWAQSAYNPPRFLMEEQSNENQYPQRHVP